jgi:gas vesicle protein
VSSEPATKQDLADAVQQIDAKFSRELADAVQQVTDKLTDAIRDSQTEVLRAF